MLLALYTLQYSKSLQSKLFAWAKNVTADSKGQNTSNKAIQESNFRLATENHKQHFISFYIHWELPDNIHTTSKIKILLQHIW